LRATPQFEQKVAVAGCSNPHAGQARSSAAPHLLQKRAPLAFSAPQVAQTRSTSRQTLFRQTVLVTHARELLQTHPTGPAIEAGLLVACIDACFDCAQSCTACADADLAEDDVETMIRCIRLCLDCSDVCVETGQVLSRQTEFDPGVAAAVVQGCAEACRVCAEECERHADEHEHCRICAEVCRHCEQTCVDVLAALGR
jgi:hypothetical protein